MNKARFGQSTRKVSDLPALSEELVNALAHALLVEERTTEEVAELFKPRGVTHKQVVALRAARLSPEFWMDAIAKLGRSNLIK